MTGAGAVLALRLRRAEAGAEAQPEAEAPRVVASGGETLPLVAMESRIPKVASGYSIQGLGTTHGGFLLCRFCKRCVDPQDMS